MPDLDVIHKDLPSVCTPIKVGNQSCEGLAKSTLTRAIPSYNTYELTRMDFTIDSVQGKAVCVGIPVFQICYFISAMS